jgi:hypothetical protein
MKNNTLLSLFVILFVSGCAGLSPGRGERNTDGAKTRSYTMNRDGFSRLVGSWKLISFHTQDPGGQKIYPFTKDAQGRLIYDFAWL